jgi:glutamate carboxypeptidase
VNDWIQAHADAIAARAPRELEALVAVSSPSGDVHGAEEAAAVAAALAPDDAIIEHIACSSPDHAPDLLIRLLGTGDRRVLLLGHLDTVVSHDDHRPLRREDDRLVGSGTIDMKGGDVLALGVLRALAHRRGDLAEAALLLVCDEEWRVGPFAHVPAFAGFDACLCFEGGQHADGG